MTVRDASVGVDEQPAIGNCATPHNNNAKGGWVSTGKDTGQQLASTPLTSPRRSQVVATTVAKGGHATKTATNNPPAHSRI